MLVFEIVVTLLLGGALLAALARRIGAPYPALVALAGAGLALVPALPTLVLDPELVLALFVAPVLLDAAFDSSPRDLRANWRTVASLALGAVALTVVVVATVAKLLVPAMPWAAAVALGAIVAPPDAAAATAVLRQLRPPHRLMVILEGESLFNDASALLVYRLAVAATMTGALSGWSVAPTLLFVTVGSLVLAFVLSRVMEWVTTRFHDVATAIVVQFCGTFAVWTLAERLHLSGILTTVVFAMLLARRAGAIIPARIRVPSYAVWEVAVFVLNVLAFILVGFQLRTVVASLGWPGVLRYTGIAAAVTAATILSRIAWVTGAAAFSRWRCRPGPDGSVRRRTDGIALAPRAAAIVGWCGMRGAVTLAAALALPTAGAEGAGFPFRGLILFTAFGVVLGTLVLQGLTLRPLMMRLQLHDDGTVDREVLHARIETLRAGLSTVRDASGDDAAALVRRRYELQLRRAEAASAASVPGEVASRAGRDAAVSSDGEVVRAAAEAERRRLVALRADGTIGDAAFQRVEQELDLAELDLEQLLAPGQASGGA
jgi:Na+/H+ antiporter